VQPAYFDAATAVPLHPVAKEALVAALDEGWADPARLYTQARRARLLLEAAQEAIAIILRVRPDEVTFTANGTEAVRAAIAGAMAARKRVGEVLVHSAIEHSAVLHAAGANGHSVKVDREGRIDRAAWEAAVGQPGVALAALISASHEVGTTQPVPWAGQVCARHGVPLFVDASMSVGRMPVPDGWNLMSASARKWGGPAGVGILVVRKATRWVSPWPEGQGSLNLPAILAAAASLQAVHAEAASENARLSELIDRIRTTVAATVPDVEIVGDPVERLPHLVTFSCLYVDGESLLHALDRRGFAVSSGSSCTSSRLEPSHVLAAMGALTHGNIRISLHHKTTSSDVDRFLAELPGIVKDLRDEVGM
jgi:cysteine desulfurase